MWATHPEMAREWEKETPKGKKLPKYAPRKKKKGKKKSAADYRAFIIKTAMGTKDYYAHLGPKDLQLIATLPNKDNVSTAYAAVKVIDILRNYYGEVASEIRQKKDPQGLIQRLLEVVKQSVGNEFEKIKGVAQHIADAIIQSAGRLARAAIVERAKNPVNNVAPFKTEDEKLEEQAQKVEAESVMQQGFPMGEDIYAFRKEMLKRLSSIK